MPRRRPSAPPAGTSARPPRPFAAPSPATCTVIYRRRSCRAPGDDRVHRRLVRGEGDGEVDGHLP
ncbi:tryptophan synthase subunit(beta) [Streptomyces spectabilis]|uniref:Tryptophan synthase subunit(Beta) n=1 Tax=Streptomyces spectabilis TaxID=68270 RepID=A0A516RKV8_STRST|nr:tryptophan synthase subunit(beta) [Streptomyces spectabilis]